MLVEPSAKPAERTAVSATLRDAFDGIGAERLGALAHLFATEIGDPDDRARSIELTGAIARLFESAGLQIDGEPALKRKQPSLSTGLPLQFVTTDRD